MTRRLRFAAEIIAVPAFSRQRIRRARFVSDVRSADRIKHFCLSTARPMRTVTSVDDEVEISDARSVDDPGSRVDRQKMAGPGPTASNTVGPYRLFEVFYS
jgi:hypothetical protein